MKIRLSLLTFLMLIFSKFASAQASFDVNGSTFNDISHEIEGHPYLQDSWQPGTLFLDNNKSINAVLKLNIYSNMVLFQDKNGQGMELKNKFYGFTLSNVDNKVSNINPVTFINGCPEIGNQTEKTLYQLIGDGKVKLLKLYKKDMHEDRERNSSVVTATYRSFRYYYILKNNRLKEIQPSKRSFTKLFDDHSAEADAYFKANTINFNSDADLQKLFNWYNALN